MPSYLPNDGATDTAKGSPCISRAIFVCAVVHCNAAITTAALPELV